MRGRHRPAEWDALTPAELGCLRAVREQLGPAAFDEVPLDVLVCFVRGSVDEKDWAATTASHLRDTLQWRAESTFCASANLEAPPSGRAAFEAAFQAGPVGHDRDGRAIIVERLGRVAPRDFCTAWPSAAFMSHCIYNKEATRSLCRELSHGNGRRLYKVVVILDLAGLGLQHGSRAFLQLLQLYVAKFDHSYPEFMTSMIMINAPLVFNAVWALVKPMLPAETVAKVQVYGGERQYRPAFERAGFTFDVPLRDAPLSWSREMARVAPGGVAPPPFVPEADRAALLTLRGSSDARYAAALLIARVMRGHAQRNRTAELLRLRRARLCAPVISPVKVAVKSGSAVGAALRRRRPSKPRELSGTPGTSADEPSSPQRSPRLRIRRPSGSLPDAGIAGTATAEEPPSGRWATPTRAPFPRGEPRKLGKAVVPTAFDGAGEAVEVSASPMSVIDVGVARLVSPRGKPLRTPPVVAQLL